MEFLREIFAFAKARRKLWILPLFLMMGVFGALIVLTKGTAVAPFIYTLF
jgi:hypothetical protein